MSPIKLLLSDVDGTLVTSDKQLAPSTIEAVRTLRKHGVGFAVTSGRPPQGFANLVGPLEITTPLAAFNGGVVVKPDMTVVLTHEIDPNIVGSLLAIVTRHRLSPWLFVGEEWLVHDLHGPHVEREEHASQMQPTVRASFDGLTAGVPKIVGVNEDHTAIAAALEDVTKEFGGAVSASSSQPYYLDITHLDANKGWVVNYLSKTLGIQPGEIATIGDGDNDVLMFNRAGLSIAMGNGSVGARQSADFTTGGNDENGFAQAIDEIVLPAA